MISHREAILSQSQIELSSSHHSTLGFFISCLFAVFFSGLIFLILNHFLPILDIIWVLVAIAYFCWGMNRSWRDIGTRRLVLDAAQKHLIVENRFPNDPEKADEITPFSVLTLYRYWAKIDYGDRPAFELKLHTKETQFPQIGGYLIHEEYADEDLATAESNSLMIAHELIQATGWAFKDIPSPIHH